MIKGEQKIQKTELSDPEKAGLIKGLVLKHLDDSINKLTELKTLSKVAKDISALNPDFLSTVPQIFLHLSMALRLTDEVNFEHVVDQLCETTKHLVTELDLDTELHKYHDYRHNHDFWFDFTQNQILDCEKIIRATFANPERAKYKKDRWDRYLDEDYKDPDDFVKLVLKELPYACRRFNDANLRTYDTNRLKVNVDKQQWVVELNQLRWHGPYKDGSSGYRCETYTDSGNFQGLMFTIFFNQETIHLSYIDKQNIDCGDYHTFRNYPI